MHKKQGWLLGGLYFYMIYQQENKNQGESGGKKIGKRGMKIP
jgi:hypothetical protein